MTKLIVTFATTSGAAGFGRELLKKAALGIVGGMAVKAGADWYERIKEKRDGNKEREA